MTASIKKPVLIALFTAAGVVLGFALINIPNVELVTATVFMAGYLLGWKEGAAAGFLTEAIYSTLNPYGMAAPPLFAAQVLAMAAAGMLGGMVRPLTGVTSLRDRASIGLCGLACTLFFALLTTLSFVLFMGFSEAGFWGSVFYGLVFYILHLVSNTLIFFAAVPAVLRAVMKTGWFPVPEKAGAAG